MCAWLPCESEKSRAWLAKRAFPVLSATLKRMQMQHCSGSYPAWDATPYVIYILRWYITTGLDFVSAGDLFPVVCELSSLSLAEPPDDGHCSQSKPELFLQASAVALDRCTSAAIKLPPECMVETALDCVRCLMSSPCKGSGHAVAQFFSSVLYGHHACSCDKSGSWSPCAELICSRLLPKVWQVLGDACAEHVLWSLKSGMPGAYTHNTIEQRLSKVASAHGGA